MKTTDIMRTASKKADSTYPREIAEGFAMISGVVSDERAEGKIEFGFLDNALFLARKNASHEDGAVRNAVIDMLISVGETSPSWRMASVETAEEIGLQPSEKARTVAARVLEVLNAPKRKG
ncbi:MAG: hypothetical protein LBB28_02530 [Synergistaceae bacterium]|jgi:hypothetical protein|nr:hypothetical protein [Synergistaceae bacterium]